MLKLLQTFLDIALWRKGPQDLPASSFLALCTLATYVGTAFVQIQLLDLRLQTAMLIVGVDVVMLLGWLWTVLAFFGRSQRFVQTLTALLGVGTLFGLADILVRAILPATGSDDNLSADWLFWLLLRFIAFALITGRIFMQALDRGLLTGMGVTLAILFSTQGVAQIMLKQMQGP